MGLLSHLFYPWGLILQGLAIVHFIRRRPDTYWIYVILFLGPIGAAVYLFVEALPDIGLVRHSFKGFSRRKRIGQLQVTIRDNPSTGNYEELGDLYLEEGKLQPARDAFDKAIAARAHTIDPFYRRGLCAIQLGDAAAALPDLEQVVAKDPDHDFYRAAGLLAHAYALTGQKEKAEALFRESPQSPPSRRPTSTMQLCWPQKAATPKHASGRRKCSTKSPMPGYQRRRERPWFRSASAC